jgi:hypothetical protein
VTTDTAWPPRCDATSHFPLDGGAHYYGFGIEGRP